MTGRAGVGAAVLSDRLISFYLISDSNTSYSTYSGCVVKIAHVNFFYKAFIKIKHYFIRFELLMVNLLLIIDTAVV